MIESVNDLKKFMNRVDFIGPVYFGSSNDQTGQVNFYNSSSQYATTFQSGNSTAAVTYTFPTAAPATSGFFLAGTTGGVLSWTNATKGTSTNDNAAAGNVGEYVTATQFTSTNFPTATQWGDGASISLTAGDWDLSGILNATANGSTFTRMQLGISSTTGNSATGLQQGDNQADTSLPVNGIRAGSACIPGWRVSIASTTIYYLKVESDYTIGTPQYTCRISARRVR